MVVRVLVWIDKAVNLGRIEDDGELGDPTATVIGLVIRISIDGILFIEGDRLSLLALTNLAALH